MSSFCISAAHTWGAGTGFDVIQTLIQIIALTLRIYVVSDKLLHLSETRQAF